jgi:serine/threonine protein kinase
LALESEALFLKRAVDSKLVDPEKGQAALAVYSQLKKMGAKFGFGQFLADQGLLTALARFALESNRDIAVFQDIGDFEVIDMLGEGQCGVVFRARQKSLDRMVAVKILNSDFAADPANVRRFQAEARATARFSHPNIVQGILTGSAHGLHFFAMEFIDGGSARSIVEASETGLDEPLALEIARQTAEGLRAAHAAGFVHRDVKPDNILLTHDGGVKLADLGISQAIRKAGDENVFWASPPYVAPEVIQGLPADSRSDIYSLGATLFELLSAKPPFHAESPREILDLHLSAPVPDVRGLRSDISHETSVLIQHMMVKQPEYRVQDAAAVISAITRILMPAQVAATRSPLKAMPVQRGHGRPVMKALAVRHSPPMVQPSMHARPAAPSARPMQPQQPATPFPAVPSPASPPPPPSRARPVRPAPAPAPIAPAAPDAKSTAKPKKRLRRRYRPRH